MAKEYQTVMRWGRTTAPVARRWPTDPNAPQEHIYAMSFSRGGPLIWTDWDKPWPQDSHAPRMLTINSYSYKTNDGK